jgi:hypothetical protein
VGVVLHAGAHDIGDLVELAVVRLEQGMEDAPLYGLEPSSRSGMARVLDHVGGVEKEIVLRKSFLT